MEITRNRIGDAPALLVQIPPEAFICSTSSFLGERILASDFDRQNAKVQIRIALMNRFTSLGTPDTIRMR